MDGGAVEIEVGAFDDAAPVFLAWAAGAPVHLVYGPDPILAVDRPGRRAYLIDDVYLAVVWVTEGGDELRAALAEAGVSREERPASDEDGTHRGLLEMVVRSGAVVPVEP